VRLIFAKLINQENELLLLDEPTNHLDIQSKEIIEKVLLNLKEEYFLFRMTRILGQLLTQKRN